MARPSLITCEFKHPLWHGVLAKHSKQHYRAILGGEEYSCSDAIESHSKKLQEWSEVNNLLKI